MDALKAIVVDDHRLVSDSLSGLLRQTKRFKTISNFYSVADATREMNKNLYDYLFTDLVMPGSNVLDFISFARANWPQLIILVVSSLINPDAARGVFKAGANGYISKRAGTAELEAAVEKTFTGGRFLSSDMGTIRLTSARPGTDAKNITKRELDILKFVAQGYTIAETAAALQLSKSTVETHRHNIMEKLGLYSAVELARYAYENKIL